MIRFDHGCQTAVANSMSAFNETHPRRFETAVQARALEIELFWKRSLFFWGFIASTFIGFAAVRSTPILALMVATFGFVCACVWTLANRGSKYWFENWETKVEEEEIRSIGPMFGVSEKIQNKGNRFVSAWLGARRFSVSRLAIGLSDYVAVLWLVIMAAELAAIFELGWRLDWLVAVYAVASIIYAIVLGVSSRSNLTSTDPKNRLNSASNGDEGPTDQICEASTEKTAGHAGN